MRARLVLQTFFRRLTAISSEFAPGDPRQAYGYSVALSYNFASPRQALLPFLDLSPLFGHRTAFVLNTHYCVAEGPCYALKGWQLGLCQRLQGLVWATSPAHSRDIVGSWRYLQCFMHFGEDHFGDVSSKPEAGDGSPQLQPEFAEPVRSEVRREELIL